MWVQTICTSIYYLFIFAVFCELSSDFSVARDWLYLALLPIVLSIVEDIFENNLLYQT